MGHYLADGIKAESSLIDVFQGNPHEILDVVCDLDVCLWRHGPDECEVRSLVGDALIVVVAVGRKYPVISVSD